MEKAERRRRRPTGNCLVACLRLSVFHFRFKSPVTESELISPSCRKVQMMQRKAATMPPTIPVSETKEPLQIEHPGSDWLNPPRAQAGHHQLTTHCTYKTNGARQLPGLCLRKETT